MTTKLWVLLINTYTSQKSTSEGTSNRWPKAVRIRGKPGFF